MIRRLGMLTAATVSVVGTIWLNSQIVIPLFDGLPGLVIVVGFLAINWAASIVSTFLVLAIQDLYESEFASSIAFGFAIEGDFVEVILLNTVLLCGGGLLLFSLAFAAFVLSIPAWVFKRA